MYYVYALYVEGEELPFYIGKGKGDRASDHLSGKDGNNSDKNDLIKEAIEVGKSIAISILHDHKTEREAFDLEIQEIKKYGRRNIGTGCLTNRTNRTFLNYGG